MGIGTVYGADEPSAVQDSAVIELRRTRRVLRPNSGCVSGAGCWGIVRQDMALQ